MKQLFILILVVFISLASNVYAQEGDDGEQLLVFKNNGTIELFFTNEVDSILTTDISQEFYTNDSVYIYLFSELDSVVVGSRNQKEIKKGVRELTDESDFKYIVRTDNCHIYYSNNTPNDVLPYVGEKLYYGGNNELMPVGLAARVSNVALNGNEWVVEIEPVELSELFDKFFYSGKVEMTKLPNEAKLLKTRSAQHEATFIPIQITLPAGDIGEFNANIAYTIEGDFVIDVSRQFYCAHFNVEFSGEVAAKLQCKEFASHNFISPKFFVPFPSIAGVLYPSIYVNLFTDINAEMNLNYSVSSVYRFEYEWKSINGVQEGRFLDSSGVPSDDGELKVDLLMNGELYMGVQAGVGLNLIGNLVGIRLDAKAGPCFEGELGVGLLRQMRDYKPKLWHKAEVLSSVKLAMTISALHHELFYLLGDEEVTTLSSFEMRLFEKPLNLFPMYENVNAIATTKKVNNNYKTNASMAAAVFEPTYTELDTGFDIVDPNDNIVDSVFVGSIKPKSEYEDIENVDVTQTFDTEISVPTAVNSDSLENYTMRPIFHYYGYTISAAPKKFKNDVLLQPYSSSLSNGFATFVSSGPFIGSCKTDSVTYQVGAYIPVQIKDNVFKHNWIPVPEVASLSSEAIAILQNKWTGSVDNEIITISFNDDMTGIFNNQDHFTYSINEPQSGELLLMFENGNTIVYRVISITDDEMRIQDKNDPDKKIITLTKG